MDADQWDTYDDVDTREVYCSSRTLRQHEGDIRALAIDEPMKDKVLQLLDGMDQETISSINVRLFAVGYMLHVISGANGGVVNDGHLEQCYDVIRHRCLDKDRHMVIRNIVKYMMYVRHILGVL
jgi:hypothetical protein